MPLIIHYRHKDCPINPDVYWQDEWECEVNGECPACGTKDIVPVGTTSTVFEEWLKDYVWPDDVPQKCTQADANGLDCLARHSTNPCRSCVEHERACICYSEDMDGQHV
jgi:hypothetical protein